MKIKPLGNRLVVKLVKKKNTTASGIIISSEEKNEQARGEIVAIGGGQGSEENITNLKLSVGDIVIFGKYSGDEVESNPGDSEEYKILSGKDVIAIIED